MWESNVQQRSKRKEVKLVQSIIDWSELCGVNEYPRYLLSCLLTPLCHLHPFPLHMPPPVGSWPSVFVTVGALHSVNGFNQIWGEHRIALMTLKKSVWSPTWAGLGWKSSRWSAKWELSRCCKLFFALWMCNKHPQQYLMSSASDPVMKDFPTKTESGAGHCSMWC